MLLVELGKARMYPASSPRGYHFTRREEFAEGRLLPNPPLHCTLTRYMFHIPSCHESSRGVVPNMPLDL